MCRETRKRETPERERASHRAALKVRQKKTSKMDTVMNFSPMETKATTETKRLTHANRRPVSRQQLPRQPAAGSGATTPGSSGPFPFAHWGLWGPLPFLF